MMWQKDEAKIKKLKKADKKEFGNEGFDSKDGYVPFQTCIDFIKLTKAGVTVGTIATQFELSINDVMTILTYWNQYIKAEEDINDIKCYGGKEYSEIQKLKQKPPLSKEDISDAMMDIYLFEKDKKDEDKDKK